MQSYGNLIAKIGAGFYVFREGFFPWRKEKVSKCYMNYN